jgi:hypothetical protein
VVGFLFVGSLSVGVTPAGDRTCGAERVGDLLILRIYIALRVRSNGAGESVGAGEPIGAG